MTLRITTLMTLCCYEESYYVECRYNHNIAQRCDTLHNDTLHNDIQKNETQHSSIKMALGNRLAKDKHSGFL
jgi:hypothetical protein